LAAKIPKEWRFDAYFLKYNDTIGPLHGLPVMLKDQYHVKGVETSMGYVGWIGTVEGKKGTRKEKSVDSEIFRELSILGAIPIGVNSIDDFSSLVRPTTISSDIQ